MAASKWTDLWLISNWTNKDQTVLMPHVWPDLKAAADERVAFAEKTHDSGFAAADTFPDFEDLQSAFVQGSTPRATDRITNAVFPSGANEGWMKNGDIVDGGTVTAIGDIPDIMDLEDLLDEISYASDTELLHDIDTNGGLQPALAKAEWYTQWYQAMNYLTWYFRKLSTGVGYTWITAMELQQTRVEVIYSYNQDTSTFNSCTADFYEPSYSGTPTDLYTANDLNESAPFSTPSEVRSYAIDLFNNNTSTWVSGNPGDVKIGLRILENVIVFPSGGLSYICDLSRTRIRFKVSEDFRALSPNKFTPDIYIYAFYICDSIVLGPPSTYSDFGTGFSEDDKELIKISADGSGWYTVEIVGYDFDTEGYLTIPSTPASGSNQDNQEFEMIRRYINPNMSTLDDNLGCVYVRPNMTDGNGFEYYTPP